METASAPLRKGFSKRNLQRETELTLLFLFMPKRNKKTVFSSELLVLCGQATMAEIDLLLEEKRNWCKSPHFLDFVSAQLP